MGIHDRSYMRDRATYGDDAPGESWQAGGGFFRTRRPLVVGTVTGTLGALLAAWGLAAAEGSLSDETMAAQAAAGWALGAVAAVLGAGLLRARRRAGWLVLALGVAAVALGVALEAAR